MGQDSTKNQYVAALWINLLSVSYGASCAWTSPSLPVLTSPDTPLESGPLTSSEASWIGAFLCVGGLCGTIIFGWLSNMLGRKFLLLLLAVPEAISWLLIIVSTNAGHFFASRFFSGMGGGGLFVLIPIFVNEISVDRVRGSLGSLLVFTCNFGIWFGYVAGYFVDYVTSAWLFLPIPIVFFIGFLFFPETPVYLLKQNKITEAKLSLCHYRGLKPFMEDSSEEFKLELEKLQGNSSNDPNDTEHKDAKVTWKDFSSKATKKAIGIGICLMALNQFCGCFAMLNYTGYLFAESGSNLSPNMSAIIVGIIQIFGSYFSTALVERAGRKLLIGGSAIGTGLGLSVMGAYMQLKFLEYDVSAFQWIPLAMFSFVIFIANWGVLTLPFLVLSEIVPQKIKSFATAFCMVNLWTFAFLAIKYFSTLFEVLGMHGTMFLFASCCFAGAIFIFLCVPETKGKSFAEIARGLE